MTRDQALARLKALRPFLAERGVTRARLFGSHARDEAGPDGEAARHVPPEIRACAPEAPWREIVATRSVIAHAYLGADLNIN